MNDNKYGAKKFLVETFITERHVVTVYADDEDAAISKVRKAYFRVDGDTEDSGRMGINLYDGVHKMSFDEDYGFKLSFGETQEEDEENGDV
jgi:hypothetical protein